MKASLRKICTVAAAALIASSLAALAGGNNTFFTAIGDLVFPFTPPPLTGGPGTIDNMTIGGTTPAPGSFTSINASAMITSSAGLPTIASGACGATTNGAVVAGSTNQTGNITIGSASTTTCTVSFSATRPSAPKACLIFPANAAAAATGTTVAYVSAITTAHFVITGSALANANYAYHCL